MFALAKRSVVSEKVDVLLRVGLGPLGKVTSCGYVSTSCVDHVNFQADLTLARYTCVALQRLNGSAKKVKGKLVHSSRAPLGNTVTDRLPPQHNPPDGDRKPSV